MNFEISNSEFALEAALLEGVRPYNNDDQEIALPCRCYGRGLTRADFKNIKWPVAMRAAAAGNKKARKKKEPEPIYEAPKLCSRGRGQLMSKSAAEFDMLMSQRSTHSSEHGQFLDGDENLNKGSPRRSLQERRSDTPDWRARSPAGNTGKESPRNNAPAIQPPSLNIQSRNQIDNLRSEENLAKEQSVPTSKQDFLPSWLDRQDETDGKTNDKKQFNIDVNYSRTSGANFCMNDLGKSSGRWGDTQFDTSSGRWGDTHFDDYDVESGFSFSSNSNTAYNNTFRASFDGYGRSAKGFNLKQEEFPGLGAAQPPEPKKNNVQAEDRRNAEKKAKGKKVKMVSYNSKENSPSKQFPADTSKASSKPVTYSNAVKDSHAPKDCQIMIKGLPAECLDTEVMNLMEPFGQVVYFNIQKDPSGYSSAIVSLDSPEKVEWAIDCLSGAESLFQVWLMHPAAMDPLGNPSLHVQLSIGKAIVKLWNSHSISQLVRQSPHLDFELRSQVDEDPNALNVVLRLPDDTFRESYLLVLSGDWMDPRNSVSWSSLDYERLLQAAAYLQMKSEDLKPLFPGTVDLHNNSRFSAAYWCYHSAPAKLNYNVFIPLLLYDMNFNESMFNNEKFTRKNFLLKMRSNLRSNIRFNAAWNPKWLSDKANNCPLTHIHECSDHLTEEELDTLVSSLLVRECEGAQKVDVHRITCIRLPEGFGPVILEHLYQYQEAKVNLNK